ncbi:MAG: MFS transporter [Frankiaceae bacterium]
MGSAPVRMLTAYAGLFDRPGTKGFVAAGFVSRLTGSMAVVGLVLALTQQGRGYAIAGTVVAALTLATGVMLPVLGRLIDRHGQHRMLVPMAAAFGASMLLLMSAIAAGAPVWLLVVLAVAAGAPMPVAGPLVRARWTRIYGGTDKLRVAYGFESATIEVVDIAGPILVTALATGIGPMAGLAAVVVCAVGGTLALAAQRSTEPEPAGGKGADRSGTSSLRIPALRSLYVVRLCTGGVFGAIPVATIAFATAHHGRAVSGLLLGAWGGTSMLAGLSYGALAERTPLPRRLTVSVALFAAGGIPLLAARGLPGLAATLALAGLAMAPATVSAMEVMQRVVPPSMLTQTMSWDTTALALGMTAGSFMAGAVAGSLGAGRAFLVPACCGLLALVAVMGGGRRIHDACLAAGHAASLAPAGHPEGVR